MNPLLSPNQLQKIYINKTYALFHEVLFNLNKKKLLLKEDKEILKKLFSYTNPQSIAKPEIYFWCTQLYLEENNTYFKNQLFLEISLLLLDLDYPSVTYKTTTSVSSPLLKESIEAGEYNLEKKENYLIINNKKKIKFTPDFKDITIGKFSPINPDLETTIPKNLDELFSASNYLPHKDYLTIKTLLKTIIILKNKSKDQLSFSHDNFLGAIHIQDNDPVLFCDSLLHETMHLEFNLIKSTYTLLTNKEEEKYYSAVINKPRPLQNCLLALHAFIPLENYYLKIPQTNNTAYISKFLDNYFKNEYLIKTLNNHAEFTTQGKLLFEDLVKSHNKNTKIVEEIQKSYKELVEKYKLECKKHKENVLKSFPDIMC